MTVSSMQLYEIQHNGRSFVFTGEDIEQLPNGTLFISASDDYGEIYSFGIDLSQLETLSI